MARGHQTNYGTFVLCISCVYFYCAFHFNITHVYARNVYTKEVTSVSVCGGCKKKRKQKRNYRNTQKEIKQHHSFTITLTHT